MRFERSFTVPASPADVLAALTDVERVAGVLPGGLVDGRARGGRFGGQFALQLGSATAPYSAIVEVAERDAPAGHAVVAVRGNDDQGDGTVDVTAAFDVAAADDGSSVSVVVEAQLGGRVADVPEADVVAEGYARNAIAQLRAGLVAATGPGAREQAGDRPVTPAPAPEPQFDPDAPTIAIRPGAAEGAPPAHPAADVDRPAAAPSDPGPAAPPDPSPPADVGQPAAAQPDAGPPAATDAGPASAPDPSPVGAPEPSPVAPPSAGPERQQPRVPEPEPDVADPALHAPPPAEEVPTASADEDAPAAPAPPAPSQPTPSRPRSERAESVAPPGYEERRVGADRDAAAGPADRASGGLLDRLRGLLRRR